jgi:hypothetical protein
VISWRSSTWTRCTNECSGLQSRSAAFGHTKIASKSLTVRGLSVLAATVCTPIAAPVIATARLRAGNATSVRGAASLITEAINTARQAGIAGDIVVRANSAFYSERFLTSCTRSGAYFSVTAKMSPKLHRAPSPASTSSPGHHRLPACGLRRAVQTVDL